MKIEEKGRVLRPIFWILCLIMSIVDLQFKMVNHLDFEIFVNIGKVIVEFPDNRIDVLSQYMTAYFAQFQFDVQPILDRFLVEPALKELYQFSKGYMQVL